MKVISRKDFVKDLDTSTVSLEEIIRFAEKIQEEEDVLYIGYYCNFFLHRDNVGGIMEILQISKNDVGILKQVDFGFNTIKSWYGPDGMLEFYKYISKYPDFLIFALFDKEKLFLEGRRCL